MNLFIFDVGLDKYAIVAANYAIAERYVLSIGRGYHGFRTIAIRDMKKSQKRQYKVIMDDPETMYKQNQITNEWEFYENA